MNQDHLTNIENLLKENGILSDKIEDYAFRPYQLNLAKNIYNVFSQKENAIIQAPTGIGKTFAYLLPSIFLSKNNKPIVICTSNKVLQDQLINKDLPLLQKTLKDICDFNFCVVKGKRNYICNKKLINNKNKIEAGIVQTEETELQKKLYIWSLITKTGETKDIDFDVTEELIKNNIISDDDECCSNKCKEYDNCFYYKQMRKDANIIVVNYSILLLDLLIKQKTENKSKILPLFDKIVFDEAHKLIDIGREFFSMNISKDSLRRTFNLLKDTYNEILKTEIFKGFDEAYVEELNSLCKNIRNNIIQLCDDVKTIMEKNKFKNNIICYYPHIKQPKTLIENISKLLSKNNIIEENLQTAEFKEILERCDEKLLEFKENVQIKLFQEIFYNTKWIESNYVANITCSKDTDNVKIQIQPIFLNELLNNLIYSQVKSKVAISATLAVKNNFNFFSEMTGFTASGMIYPQCFDLKNQVRVTVDMNAPSYDTENIDNYKDYLEKMSDIIIDVIKEREGGVLILTTSISSVNELYNLLTLKQYKYPIISQLEEINTFKAIEKFKNHRESCLIGTMSLWEGIDVPGSSLNTVFVVKLPFKQKNDPIINALQSKKYDWFTKYSLPLAVLTFKQGIGRLIRNENDTGLIYIADPRVNKKIKPYGETFVEDLIKEKVPIVYL